MACQPSNLALSTCSISASRWLTLRITENSPGVNHFSQVVSLTRILVRWEYRTPVRVTLTTMLGLQNATSSSSSIFRHVVSERNSSIQNGVESDSLGDVLR